jgi:hypothetical protein
MDDAGVDAAQAEDVGLDVGVDASHDAATNVDASTVCTARVCDDFESAPANRIPPWQWTIGAASRSTTLAHGGVASGHFSAPATGPGDRQQAIGVNLPNTITEVWLRFWAYVPSTSMPNNLGVASLAEASGANDSILLNDHGWAMYAQGPAIYRGEIPLTPDHWTCVSYHAVLTNPGSLTLTIDHQTPLVATGINAAFTPGIDNAEIGLTFVDVAQATAFDIFMDDATLTVDGTALPCP